MFFHTLHPRSKMPITAGMFRGWEISRYLTERYCVFFFFSGNYSHLISMDTNIHFPKWHMGTLLHDIKGFFWEGQVFKRVSGRCSYFWRIIIIIKITANIAGSLSLMNPSSCSSYECHVWSYTMTRMNVHLWSADFAPLLWTALRDELQPRPPPLSVYTLPASGTFFPFKTRAAHAGNPNPITAGKQKS